MSVVMVWALRTLPFLPPNIYYMPCPGDSATIQQRVGYGVPDSSLGHGKPLLGGACFLPVRPKAKAGSGGQGFRERGLYPRACLKLASEVGMVFVWGRNFSLA